MSIRHPLFLASVVAAMSFGISLIAVTLPLRIGGNAQGIPVDPGVRTTGNLFTYSQPFATLSATEFLNFGCPDGTISSCAANTTSGAQGIFNQQWSATGTVAGQSAPGLGPYYDTNACFWCHSYPVAGGTASATTNPEVAQASLNSRGPSFVANVIPTAHYITPDGIDTGAFIRSNGPTIIPFQRSTNSLKQLWTVGGIGGAMMTDMAALSGCTSSAAPQPDWNTIVNAGDASPVVPKPLMGLGLIEATPDANFILQQNASKFSVFGMNAGCGVGGGYGCFNNTGISGNIGKMGWKASLPSVNYFESNAMARDIGVSSELFPQKNNPVPACDTGAALPNDHAPLTSRGTCSNCAMDFASNAEGDTYFVTHLESWTPVWGTTGAYTAPVPAGWNGSATTAYSTATTNVTQGSVYNGYQQFVAIGCDTCHVPSHTTGPSITTGLSSKTYYNFGDRALHRMGSGMDNGISIGKATGAHFLTQDLWGLGQRFWLNHDGRTSNLYTAIQEHCTPGSEAAVVWSTFSSLSLPNQQDLLNFLRGL